MNRKKGLYWIFPAIFLLITVVYWIVFAVAPEFHQRWIRSEDHAVEWGTFTGFFLASVFTASALRFRKNMDVWSILYIVGLALFFFLCAGEEISWGQRVFGFHTPHEVAAINKQGEMNLHNLRIRDFHPLGIVSALIKGFGVVAPLVLLAWRRIDPRVWHRYIAPVWVVPCLLFAEITVPVRRLVQPWITEHYGSGVALIVKLDTVELKEMFWGLSLMLAAISIYGAWVMRERELQQS